MPIKKDLSDVAIAICEACGLIFDRSEGRGEFKQTFHVKNSKRLSFALKVFFQGTSNERNDREISAMERCCHPCIAKLYSVGEIESEGVKYLYILEEYLDGGTLTRVLEKGLVNKADIKPLGRALIQAIAHIASLGLVHRDLKPDNIMFRQGCPEPTIVDFGLVRDLAMSSITNTWAMHGPGTPYYSSPEQLNNEKELIDWRTDQFAIGVILSIATFGIHPYAQVGDAPETVVRRVAMREMQSPAFVEYATDNSMKQLIHMTSQWPVRRYRTPSILMSSWLG